MRKANVTSRAVNVPIKNHFIILFPLASLFWKINEKIFHLSGTSVTNFTAKIDELSHRALTVPLLGLCVCVPGGGSGGAVELSSCGARCRLALMKWLMGFAEVCVQAKTSGDQLNNKLCTAREKALKGGGGGRLATA